ncbi:uncharacterized protein LOC143462512 [Clavelina lepadiformis]|uniref:uncharacterized protein LOC143462512 n=1 Tax=Clavelina lepadiformis TaxID=159417 RepID=UPI004040ECFF
MDRFSLIVLVLGSWCLVGAAGVEPVSAVDEYWSEWSEFVPSNSAANRIRSRTCNTTDVICTSNYYMEEYQNCFVTCASFGLPTVSGCMGDCDIGFQTTTFPCDDGTLCMYLRNHYCLASCSGTWNEWEQTSECNRNCDGGTYTRQRFCQNPDGSASTNCQGAGGSNIETGTQVCNTEACPVLGEWSDFTTCSHSCDGGNQTRTRFCLEATAPSLDGIGCPGGQTSYSESQPCMTQACPAYGAYVNGTCSVTCGGGNLTRTRTCTYEGSPSSLCPGASATGEMSVIVTCNTQNCSYWTDWTEVGNCSEPCDGGMISRTRDCVNNGAPATDCNGTQTDSVPCNTFECLGYGNWTAIDACNATCDGGYQNWERYCLISGNCTGPDTLTEQRECNTNACEYGSWSNITECSEPCGNGTWTEERNCVTVGCSKTETRTEICNLQDCTFGNWTDAGVCSVTCGGGTLDQERLCNVPGCTLTENRTISCNTDDCPAAIAGAGGNIPLLISIASIVGALAISAAAYMTVTACLGLAAAGDEKKRVTATSAFAIYAIQAGTLGMIQWRGKTKLKMKNRRRNLLACCGGDNNEPEYGDVVPMVRIFGRKTPGESREALDTPADDIPTDSTDPFNTSAPYTTDAPQTSAPYTSGPLQGNPQQSGVGLAELTKWARQMIGDSKNINETDVYDLNKSNNNSSIWAINDDRVDVSHYAWVHTRSFSGRKAMSTFNKDRESVYDHTYTVMK